VNNVVARRSRSDFYLLGERSPQHAERRADALSAILCTALIARQSSSALIARQSGRSRRVPGRPGGTGWAQCERRPAGTGRRRSHEPRVTRRAPALCRRANPPRRDHPTRPPDSAGSAWVPEAACASPELRGKPSPYRTLSRLYAYRLMIGRPDGRSSFVLRLSTSHRDDGAARTKPGRRLPPRRPGRQPRRPGYAEIRARSATGAGPDC
jgi:hypothetical protein